MPAPNHIGAMIDACDPWPDATTVTLQRGAVLVLLPILCRHSVGAQWLNLSAPTCSPRPQHPSPERQPGRNTLTLCHHTYPRIGILQGALRYVTVIAVAKTRAGMAPTPWKSLANTGRRLSSWEVGMSREQRCSAPFGLPQTLPGLLHLGSNSGGLART